MNPVSCPTTQSQYLTFVLCFYRGFPSIFSSKKCVSKTMCFRKISGSKNAEFILRTIIYMHRVNFYCGRQKEGKELRENQSLFLCHGKCDNSQTVKDGFHISLRGVILSVLLVLRWRLPQAANVIWYHYSYPYLPCVCFIFGCFSFPKLPHKSLG